MKFEDHFSQLADIYSRYRPLYPSSLFRYLAECCKEHELVWDCGTGNGQAAFALTEHFEKVFATDASKEQIALAVQHPRINYKVEHAEKVSLPDSSTDLVTVAVAVHWFDYEKFFTEVKRVLKLDGVIAVWGYHFPKISPKIDAVLKNYYENILKGYWPKRFSYTDELYKTLPFPFDEIIPPEFEMNTEWDLTQLAGFLNSWSGTKNYQQNNGVNPISIVWDELITAWGNEKTKKKLKWPLHVRVGKLNE